MHVAAEDTWFCTRSVAMKVLFTCFSLGAATSLGRTHSRFITSIAMMTPSTPSGYVTAQLSAGAAVGCPICARVCCEAPRAGVFVVAPHITPTMSGIGTSKKKREGYGHDRTQSYDGQPQHIEAHAPGAEGAHESRADLQAERIDEQRQTERLGKEQHLRIDRHAEVSGHNAGKEYERDTQRHAPDVYLAQQQPHGAHDRDDDDGLQGRMRHEERFEHYRYCFLSLLSYLHLLKQVRCPAYAVDDE